MSRIACVAAAPHTARRRTQRRVPDLYRGSLARAFDALRERWLESDQPRVERELPAVIHLLRDPVMEPLHARSLVSVETQDELQHVQLSGASILFDAVS